MLRTVFQRSQLQHVDPERLEAFVLRAYVRLYERFLADRERIPERNLVELRFDDLQATPIDALRQIYEGLGLPGFRDAAPHFRAYLEGVAGYKKNVYDFADDVIETVNKHWSFAFETFGYERLEPGAAPRN